MVMGDDVSVGVADAAAAADGTAAANDDSNAATAALCTSHNSLFISMPTARPAPPKCTAANKTPAVSDLTATIAVESAKL